MITIICEQVSILNEIMVHVPVLVFKLEITHMYAIHTKKNLYPPSKISLLFCSITLFLHIHVYAHYMLIP